MGPLRLDWYYPCYRSPANRRIHRCAGTAVRRPRSRTYLLVKESEYREVKCWLLSRIVAARSNRLSNIECRKGMQCPRDHRRPVPSIPTLRYDHSELLFGNL